MLRRLIALCVLLVMPVTARADVMVHEPASYETASGMTVGIALMGLHSDIEDKLVAASSPVCAEVEIHSMKEENGIMKMRREESIDLPADRIVKLEPGGYHLMLIGLKEPLKADTSFEVTITFARGKQETITVPVQSRSALKKALDVPANHEH